MNDFRNAGHAGRASRQKPLSLRRPADRGRLAAVHDAGALRCGLCRPLQVQHPPHRRLQEPLGLPARSLPDAGRRGDGEPAPHQGALLPQPQDDQSDAAWSRSARRSISSACTAAPSLPLLRESYQKWAAGSSPLNSLSLRLVASVVPSGRPSSAKKPHSSNFAIRLARRGLLDLVRGRRPHDRAGSPMR